MANSSLSHLTPTPLEDDACDVIRKAMLGSGISADQLSNICGLPLETILLSKTPDAPPLSEAEITHIAHALDLSAKALICLPSYTPNTPTPDQLFQIISPFGHAGVNSFIIEHHQKATLFDTGTDATPILRHLKQRNLTLDAIYITHQHHDHISGLTGLAGLAKSPECPLVFPSDIVHGEKRELAPGIQLTALETSGHFTPSRAYLITGLSTPICICGDILFAGSMGKTPDPEQYRRSIRHAKKYIMTLPADTILCPGHGPLTTVTQEHQHNPFLRP